MALRKLEQKKKARRRDEPKGRKDPDVIGRPSGKAEAEARQIPGNSPDHRGHAPVDPRTAARRRSLVAQLLVAGVSLDQVRVELAEREGLGVDRVNQLIADFRAEQRLRATEAREVGRLDSYDRLLADGTRARAKQDYGVAVQIENRMSKLMGWDAPPEPASRDATSDLLSVFGSMTVEEAQAKIELAKARLEAERARRDEE